MAKVFISHAWEDNILTRKIAGYLIHDGVDTWIDHARMSGGDNIPRKIKEAIDWCDMMVLVWSTAAADSFFVELEWTTAMANRKPVIPCIIDGTRLPVVLSGCLHLDFQDFNKGYQSLKHALEHTIAIIKSTQNDDAKKIPDNIKQLRNIPVELSPDDVMDLLKKYDFFCREWDWNGAFCNPCGRGIKHLYQQLKDEKVVVDDVSGLMWQQSGAPEEKTFDLTLEYLDDLNNSEFAGFNNWRLPTLEEAMSLLQPEINNARLYIASVFDKAQPYIWTADPVKNKPGWYWVVDFHNGYCDGGFVNYYGCVRAIRAGNAGAGGTFPLEGELKGGVKT